VTRATPRSHTDSSEARLRAFLAIPLTHALRQALEREILSMRDESWATAVRFVRGEGLHVTLRFLGDIPRSDIDAVVGQVVRAVSGLSSFDVALHEIALFPSWRRPHVVAAVLERSEPLAELAARIEASVVSLGFKPERRPFRGHVTLGRWRGRAGRATERTERPELRGELDSYSLPVERVVLYRSQLSHAGARYSELASLSLAGASGAAG